MKAALKISSLVLMLAVLGGIAAAQDQGEGNLAEKQKAPTVLGGTGLFNTFSTRTLCKGEFNFAVFWNNFDRDPGDLSINQVPFNITVGLTNRWEVWADWVTWQQVTSRNPLLLSGYQLSAVNFFGNPTTILGPAVGGKNGGAAFFPGTGAGVGGILPTPGRFGTPLNFTTPFTIGSGPPAFGLGVPVSSDKPNYNQAYPFFGEVDFVGFNSSGDPVFGPRESSNGSSDIYLGTKYSLISPDKHWFSMALGGYLKIPIAQNDQARARGRTNGEFEGGPILILGQESKGHRFRLYENIGYIHTGDISENGVKVLDLRDHLIMNAGVSVGINKHIEFLSELASTVYVGGGTPSIDNNDPVDWNIGARFYFRNGSISFGGAYRRFLNDTGSTTVPVLSFAAPAPPFFRPPPSFTTVPLTFPNQGSDNGFVVFFSIGRRNQCPPPPAPTCVLEANPTTVNRGESVKVNAKPTTPGYQDAKVTYDYHWDVKNAQGQSVSVSGTGAGVDIPTGSLACGNYTVTSTVTAHVPMVDCPSDCVTVGTTTCSTSFTVTEPPCPTVTCEVTANPTQVMVGEKVTLTANGHGEGTLSYTWSTSAGTLSSTTGSEVTLDTTGTDGTITVTVNVATDKKRCDEGCPGSSCNTTVTVGQAPVTPVAPVQPCGPLYFPFNSARINNEHKACLDEVALKMQQDPRSSVVIDGDRDTKERVGISLTRANNARDYLVNEKGIDAARITVRNYGDTCPDPSGDSALNRRVVLWFLPDGAKMEGIDSSKECASGSTPQVLTNEEPAPSTDVRRPRRGHRRPRRKTKHAEPVVMMAAPSSR